ncbi:hypothetical protein [Actinoplanes sp. L3-i22]|uniref:hypothetical protein n=1 Tax=Actinoplanes sp. L3-i22 TaxID=2836373 RepID=UPI001C844904|nr:hypothetical protein [Actinoplanes sp. L3-i22]
MYPARAPRSPGSRDHGYRYLFEGRYRRPALTRVEELPGLLLCSTVQGDYVTVGTSELDPETAAGLTAFVRARVAGA